MCHGCCLEIRDSCHCRGEVKFLLFQVKSKGTVMLLLIVEWWMQLDLCPMPPAAERMVECDVPSFLSRLQYFANFLVL